MAQNNTIVYANNIDINMDVITKNDADSINYTNYNTKNYRPCDIVAMNNLSYPIDADYADVNIIVITV